MSLHGSLGVSHFLQVGLVSLRLLATLCTHTHTHIAWLSAVPRTEHGGFPARRAKEEVRRGAARKNCFQAFMHTVASCMIRRLLEYFGHGAVSVQTLREPC